MLLPMGVPENFVEATEVAQGVLDRFPLLMNRVAWEIAGRAEVGLGELGLTGMSYMALAILENDHPQSQLEVSRLVGCAPAQVVSLADELERLGFVERVRDPADRRRSLLKVTQAGRKALAKGDRVAEDVEAGMFGHLDPDERGRMHAALRTAITPAAAPA